MKTEIIYELDRTDESLQSISSGNIVCITPTKYKNISNGKSDSECQCVILNNRSGHDSDQHKSLQIRPSVLKVLCKSVNTSYYQERMAYKCPTNCPQGATGTSDSVVCIRIPRGIQCSDRDLDYEAERTPKSFSPQICFFTPPLQQPPSNPTYRPSCSIPCRAPPYPSTPPCSSSRPHPCSPPCRLTPFPPPPCSPPCSPIPCPPPPCSPPCRPTPCPPPPCSPPCRPTYCPPPTYSPPCRPTPCSPPPCTTPCRPTYCPPSTCSPPCGSTPCPLPPCRPTPCSAPPCSPPRRPALCLPPTCSSPCSNTPCPPTPCAPSYRSIPCPRPCRPPSSPPCLPSCSSCTQTCLPPCSPPPCTRPSCTSCTQTTPPCSIPSCPRHDCVPLSPCRPPTYCPPPSCVLTPPCRPRSPPCLSPSIPPCNDPCSPPPCLPLRCRPSCKPQPCKILPPCTKSCPPKILCKPFPLGLLSKNSCKTVWGSFSPCCPTDCETPYELPPCCPSKCSLPDGFFQVEQPLMAPPDRLTKSSGNDTPAGDFQSSFIHVPCKYCGIPPCAALSSMICPICKHKNTTNDSYFNSNTPTTKSNDTSESKQTSLKHSCKCRVETIQEGNFSSLPNKFENDDSVEHSSSSASSTPSNSVPPDESRSCESLDYPCKPLKPRMTDLRENSSESSLTCPSKKASCPAKPPPCPGAGNRPCPAYPATPCRNPKEQTDDERMVDPGENSAETSFVCPSKNPSCSAKPPLCPGAGNRPCPVYPAKPCRNPKEQTDDERMVNHSENSAETSFICPSKNPSCPAKPPPCPGAGNRPCPVYPAKPCRKPKEQTDDERMVNPGENYPEKSFICPSKNASPPGKPPPCPGTRNKPCPAFPAKPCSNRRKSTLGADTDYAKFNRSRKKFEDQNGGDSRYAAKDRISNQDNDQILLPVLIQSPSPLQEVQNTRNKTTVSRKSRKDLQTPDRASSVSPDPSSNLRPAYTDNHHPDIQVYTCTDEKPSNTNKISEQTKCSCSLEMCKCNQTTTHEEKDVQCPGSKQCTCQTEPKEDATVQCNCKAHAGMTCECDETNKTKEKLCKCKKSSSSSSSSNFNSSSESYMSCICCKKEKILKKLINKIPLCEPCQEVNQKNFYPHNYSNPLHSCLCYNLVDRDILHQFKQTLTEIERLDIYQQYCEVLKNCKCCKQCGCKCKLPKKFKNGCAYFLKLEDACPNTHCDDEESNFDSSNYDEGEEGGGNYLPEVTVKVPNCKGSCARKRENGRDTKKYKSCPSIQNYLCTMKPDFVERAERRRQLLKDATSQREENSDKRKLKFIERIGYLNQRNRNDKFSNDIKSAGYQTKAYCVYDIELNDSPKRVRPRVFKSFKEMKDLTRRKYLHLNEVKSKKDIHREKRLREANRLLANTFTRRLQKSTLRGAVDIPLNVKVVSY